MWKKPWKINLNLLKQHFWYTAKNLKSVKTLKMKVLKKEIKKQQKDYKSQEKEIHNLQKVNLERLDSIKTLKEDLRNNNNNVEEDSHPFSSHPPSKTSNNVHTLKMTEQTSTNLFPSLTHPESLSSRSLEAPPTK